MGLRRRRLAEEWAKKTIAEHARDEREYLYSLAQLEGAKTHDALWNAAQTQMLKFGWMHNVMRMYWARKILEWTPDVGTAVKYAVHLNDKYFLDGRDPNGCAGVAWAIVGSSTARGVKGRCSGRSGTCRFSAASAGLVRTVNLTLVVQ